MTVFYKLCPAFFLVLLLGAGKPVLATNPDYEQRKTDYINAALSNVNSDAITLQAYQGVPVDSAILHSILNGIITNDVVDFNLVKLVRILFFTNGQYDSLIMPALNSVPFWLHKDEQLRVYWSENHMIMWMSSDWLLHERYGRAIDSTLDNRLRHYLRMKIQYGFYEFFSSVYQPYTLTGLLNLVDFAQDPEIKSLAAQAAQRLLKDLLMLTNDKGVFFPAAGRNYYGKYEQAHGQNHSHLIHLLTGMGPFPGSASHAGAFLASSTLDVDSVITSWTPNLDTLYTIGHSLDSSFVINADQSFADKVIFQWSAGTYFHPAVALETATLLRDSTLWNHAEFAGFTQYANLDISQAPLLAQLAGVISKSSSIMGQDVAIFKHGAITLSSIQDFWKGKLGYQQFPCVANVGTTAVFIATGDAARDWNNGSSHNANEHLPSVHQEKNVALLMFRPEVEKLHFFDHDSLSAVLHWKEGDFDETLEDGFWILGRQEDSYIAVRRSCTDKVSGNSACDKPNGQAWVIVVGDSGMYGSFANFHNIVNQSQLEESRYIDTNASQSVYYAKIFFDTTSIEYTWAVDTLLILSDNTLSGKEKSFSVFPNPANDVVNFDLSSLANEPVTVKVLNMFGAEIYRQRIENSKASAYSISTANWPQGIYLITIQQRQKRFTEKLVKAE